MKAAVLLVVFSFMLASRGYAEPLDRSGGYVGAEMPFAANSDITIGGFSIDPSHEIGYALEGGYQFEMSNEFVLGVGLAMQNFGTMKYSDVSTTKTNAVMFMVRPKYYLESTNFFIAGVFGYGWSDIDVRNHYNQLHVKDDGSASTYGIEFGADFEQLEVSAGYRDMRATIGVGYQDVNVDTSGPYVGIRYVFN
ncbi:autotransporter domain-containing protein [Vibrio barjaei]|uniref:autotransporter domain-containing protein n=1 Tax=Vibrio barjaei TaxID=1676683 RepID=UPI0022845DE9|nr:autotransporter domain-containing protein [Vibrio barjaei]MCY9870338.1 autotransporter domain-containing protein [Vibrio barjaei]